MLTSLGIVLVAPLGLLTARAAGFSPETQILTAVETILANLCWLPPAMGRWLARRRSSDKRRVGQESVSTCRSRLVPYTQKKNQQQHNLNLYTHLYIHLK